MKAILVLLLVVFAQGAFSQTNIWEQMSDFGGGPRASAVGFSIGPKGYILTGGSNTEVTNDLWEYDTLTSNWTQKTSFPGNPRESAVAFSIGDKGYIGTGMDWSGNFYTDFWEYDPLTDTWTQKADFSGGARYGAVGFSANGNGYIGAGTNGTSKNDFWEYDPALNTWSTITSLPALARYGAFAFSINEKGYIGGGIGSTGVLNDFWEYNPVLNTWTQKADVVAPSASYASSFSIGSTGFVHTFSGSNFGKYEQASNIWLMIADLEISRNRAVGFSIGDYGYIGTGQNGSGRRADFWRYTPCSDYSVATITIDGPTEFCEGGSVVLTASEGVSYMWWNSETTQSITVTNSGMYAVIITDSCGVATSEPVEITVFPAPAVPEITQFDSLLTSSAAEGNQWFFEGEIIVGANGQDLVATLIGAYSVEVTNLDGCTSSASFDYNGNPNYQAVPVCLVTVDSLSENNIVVWDKSLTPAVDTFVILRETSTDVYQPIGKVPYDSLSQYIDTVRTLYFPNTGDPNSGTYRYKMQCIDSYGVYSPLSAYHNTLFLYDDAGVFTLLQKYEIEGGENPVSSYVLMRDDLSNGNWHEVGSVAGTQNFIIDPDYSVYLSTSSWRVKTIWSINCTPEYKTPGDYNTSLSNIYNYATSSFTELEKPGNLEIFPNPFSNETVIKLKDNTEGATLVIYNSVGTQVRKLEAVSGKDIKLNRDNLVDGIYLIRLSEGNRLIASGKIIIE